MIGPLFITHAVSLLISSFSFESGVINLPSQQNLEGKSSKPRLVGSGGEGGTKPIIAKRKDRDDGEYNSSNHGFFEETENKNFVSSKHPSFGHDLPLTGEEPQQKNKRRKSKSPQNRYHSGDYDGNSNYSPEDNGFHSGSSHSHSGAGGRASSGRYKDTGEYMEEAYGSQTSNEENEFLKILKSLPESQRREILKALMRGEQADESDSNDEDEGDTSLISSDHNAMLNSANDSSTQEDSASDNGPKAKTKAPKPSRLNRPLKSRKKNEDELGK